VASSSMRAWSRATSTSGWPRRAKRSVGGADAGGCAGDEDGRQGHGGGYRRLGRTKNRPLSVLCDQTVLAAKKHRAGQHSSAPQRQGAVAEGAHASVA
jgi:hypothetical protein